MYKFLATAVLVTFCLAVSNTLAFSADHVDKEAFKVLGGKVDKLEKRVADIEKKLSKDKCKCPDCTCPDCTCDDKGCNCPDCFYTYENGYLLAEKQRVPFIVWVDTDNPVHVSGYINIKSKKLANNWGTSKVVVGTWLGNLPIVNLYSGPLDSVSVSNFVKGLSMKAVPQLSIPQGFQFPQFGGCQNGRCPTGGCSGGNCPR